MFPACLWFYVNLYKLKLVDYVTVQWHNIIFVMSYGNFKYIALLGKLPSRRMWQEATVPLVDTIDPRCASCFTNMADHNSVTLPFVIIKRDEIHFWGRNSNNWARLDWTGIRSTALNCWAMEEELDRLMDEGTSLLLRLTGQLIPFICCSDAWRVTVKVLQYILVSLWRFLDDGKPHV